MQGRKAFFDPEEFPFVAEMEANWEKIQAEFLQVWESEYVPNIQDVFKEQSLIAKDENWKSYMLLLYGFDFKDHIDKCPETYRLMKKIPGISSAMFSILAPGKHLPPHHGPYRGVLRYHLGLVVPDEEKCHIVVDGEKRHWQEGKSMVFDDTWLHEAHNNSDKPRAILFVDFIRTLPFPLNIINKFLFGLMTKSAFIQNVLKETEKMEQMEFKKRNLDF